MSGGGRTLRRRFDAVRAVLSGPETGQVQLQTGDGVEQVDVPDEEKVQRFLPPPGPEAETCGPGPFSMADESTTRAKMEAAGFTDIAFERIDAKVNVGRDIEDAVRFQLAIGPAGETYRTAGEAGVARRAEIVIALSDLFEEVIDREGGLWMDSSSWLITARAPA